MNAQRRSSSFSELDAQMVGKALVQTQYQFPTTKYVYVFLVTADMIETRQGTIAKDVKMKLDGGRKSSTTSRILQQLSDEPAYDGDRRFGLIRMRPSPESGKEKVLELTPKGRAFFKWLKGG